MFLTLLPPKDKKYPYTSVEPSCLNNLLSSANVGKDKIQVHTIMYTSLHSRSCTLDASRYKKLYVIMYE